MEKLNKITEKFGKTMDKWTETLGNSLKMVCRRRYIRGNIRNTGIEESP